MSMNIFHAVPGSRVVFANPAAGYPHDQTVAAEHLEEGRTYVVEKVEIRDWRTEITLRDVPRVWFNSVLFEDAPEPAPVNQDLQP